MFIDYTQLRIGFAFNTHAIHVTHAACLASHVLRLFGARQSNALLVFGLSDPCIVCLDDVLVIIYLMATRDTAKKRLRLQQADEATARDRSRSPKAKGTAKHRMLAEAKLGPKRRERPMHHKQEDSDNHDSDEDDFRDACLDLYLRNKLSAKDTSKLVRSAHGSGSSGLSDMKTIGKKCPRNSQRDLMRKILKKIDMPPPYYADVPVKDRKNGIRKMVSFPFMLVHELLLRIILAFGMGFNDILQFPAGSGLHTMQNQWRKDHNIPTDAMVVPIGIHGDGVPLQRSMSMYCIAWNISSVAGSERNLFTCIEKQDLCDCGCGGRCALDAILGIFTWDMMSLYTGMHPTRRHDQTEWSATDKYRKSKQGPTGVRANLMQCRGDWPWLKWRFGFKGWTSNDHVCWRCRANKGNIPYWDPKPNAKWRKKRINAAEFARLVRENGCDMSPLFSLPGFTLLHICIDSLHALDLGFAQEILGNIFYECLGPFAMGRNKKEQLSDFIQKMKAHYKRMGTPNRIGNVTLDMLKRDGKAPKLRAKGAETRHVAPFALEIATAMYANDPNEHTNNVLKCVSGLMDFYMIMGMEPYPVAEAKVACEQMCTAYVALHDATIPNRWALKPKIHMFMEMALFQTEELGSPMLYWNYKDEDYVGFLSEIGESRGGPGSATTTPLRVIERVRALGR